MRSTRLVGRDAEQCRLADAVAEARAGRPAAVLVEGEAGIGKTRLITDAIERHTAQDDVVLVGHGVDLAGGEMPFGVATSALRDLIHREGLDAVRSRAGPGAEPLGALVPELSSGQAPDPDRNRIIDAFVGVVDNLSHDRLTWLLVEDLQWADTSSRDLLGYLARVVHAPAHLLVTCTLRTHDKRQSVELSTFVEELVRSPAVSRITLQRLGRDDVAAHLTSLLDEPPAPPLLDRVVALSEGIPFFTEELVLWGSHGGSLPESVTAMMSARVESLSPSAQHLVRTASLGERDVRHAALRAVCALADQDFTAALVEALQSSVLESDESRDGYQFRHALLREAVAGSLLLEERVNGHRRWAEELDAEADASGDVLTRIRAAHHWAETGDQDRAFDAALQAADWAHSVGAEAERATLLTRALGSWDAIGDAEARAGLDRDDLVEEIVWAHMWAGTLTTAAELVDAELLQVGEGADAQARRLHLQLTRDWIAGELDDLDPGGVQAEDHERLAPTLPESIALVRDLPRSKLFVRVVTDLVAWSHDSATALDLEDLMAEAVDFVEHSGTDLDRFVVQHELAHLWWLLGRREPSVSLNLDMLPRLYRKLPLSAAIMWANNTMGRLAVMGRFREAAQLGADTLRRAGSPELAPRLWSLLAAHLMVIFVDLGRWEEAERLRSRAASASAGYFPPWGDLYAGLVRCWSGDIRGAQDLLDQAGHARPGLSDRAARVPELERSLLEAQIALATGDLTDARDALRSIYSSREFIGDGDMWRILLLAARVEVDDSRRLARKRRSSPSTPTQRMDEIQRVATEVIAAGDLGEAWSVQLAAERGRFEGFTDSEPWAAAVSGWTRTGQVHEQAWALVRLAECHLANGDSDGAREALREAIEIGERLGAVPLVDAAAAVSRRGRLRVQPSATAVEAETKEQRPSRHGLTAREVEVLQLVADGLSNDQIGKELFISPRTASVHVSRILAKLGVASRSEATTFAHRAGLLEHT